MLDLDRIDLGDLRTALDDHSPDHSWLLDPTTGAIYLHSDQADESFESMMRDLGVDHPGTIITIEPWPSHLGYGDMKDFIGHAIPRHVTCSSARSPAAGRFGGFKDDLADYPELREAWYALSGARAERRAIGWMRPRTPMAAAST